MSQITFEILLEAPRQKTDATIRRTKIWESLPNFYQDKDFCPIIGIRYVLESWEIKTMRIAQNEVQVLNLLVSVPSHLSSALDLSATAPP